MEYRTQLEKIVLELHQLSMKSDFEYQVAKLATDYATVQLIKKKQAADSIKEIYDIIKKIYNEANRC